MPEPYDTEVHDTTFSLPSVAVATIAAHVREGAVMHA